MSKQYALVIDDERDIRELLTLTLGRMDLIVETAATVAEARQRLAERRYALCFTDMRLPDGSGQEIVELIAAQFTETPVAMITAYGNVDAAVTALKAGAFDFVSKPVDISVLRRLVQTALKLSEEKRADQTASSSKLIGDSPPMVELRATISKVARSQAPVYIAGESGVGKELAARLIHELGPRSGSPFVPVNCGAIPSELMESEFFGHKKGSFTGAHADKDGLFQAAQGGTLFLDEVAELPVHMQVKLLRVIQEKAVRTIGARAELPVDVRILSATHKNLARLVELGSFRQDLFYRINVIELRVPPLRERREDIPKLAGARARAPRPAQRHRTRAPRAGRAEIAARLRFSRQRARARERARARRRDVRERQHHGGGSAAHAAVRVPPKWPSRVWAKASRRAWPRNLPPPRSGDAVPAVVIGREPGRR